MKVRRRTQNAAAWKKLAEWLNPRSWFARFSLSPKHSRRGWTKKASEPLETADQSPSGSDGDLSIDTAVAESPMPGHHPGTRNPTPTDAPTSDMPPSTQPKPIRTTVSTRGNGKGRSISGLDGRWLFGGTLMGSMLTGYLVAAVFFFPAPFFSSTESVPRVIDLTIAEAREALEEANLIAGDPRRENHPSYSPGHVAWQDPPEGVRVPPGTIIRLAISRGPQEIPVPDVSRYDSDLAATLITRSGLSVSRLDSIQTALPKGVAVGSRPAAGATLEPGSGVVLIVSRGAPTISVPDMAGLTLDEAREELSRLGLTMGQSWQEFSNAQPEGFIFRQEPPAGTLIAAGTPINVVIARTP